MRWKLYERLKAIYGDRLHLTYGSTTSYHRNKAGLTKTHAVDARCISGNPNAKPADHIYYQKKARCHNRQIHKATILKGGIRKRNQAEHEVRGFRLNDRVKAKGREYFVHGRRTKGAFLLKNLAGDKLEITPAKIKLISHSGHMITERREALLPSL